MQHVIILSLIVGLGVTAPTSQPPPPPIGPLNLVNAHNDNGWLNSDMFGRLRSEHSGTAAPVVATQELHPMKQRQQLIGGQHDVNFELAKPQLLGEDGGAANPFAGDFRAPTATISNNLLGADGGAANPFAMDFRPPTAQQVAEAHGNLDSQNNYDAFFRNMERMHERMNEMIRNELQMPGERPFFGPPMMPQHMPMMMNMAEPQFYVEVQKWDPEHPEGEKQVWSNMPGFENTDNSLDLADHEPSPPTFSDKKERENFVQASRPFFAEREALESSDESSAERDYRRSVGAMACLRRRIAHLSHTAKIMFCITVFLVFFTLGLLLMYLCKRVARKDRPTIYVPPSPTRSMSIATVEKPPVYTASEEKIHKPPAYEGEVNPNYEETKEAEKNADDIKVAA